VTDKNIKDTVRKLLDEIEVLRIQAWNKGLAFSSLTAEQLEKKLKSTHTPSIYGLVWTGSGSASSTFYCEFHVYNPGPDTYYSLYAYFFFGPANMIPSVDTALLSVDERLFRMFAKFPNMSPSSNGSVQFKYSFPSGSTLGMYMGNAFLLLRSSHDVGAYLDRASIDVEIW
jgi:hypothetical protein